MSGIANFSVDPKITHILGEGYTSCERALRELVDNAWDAEALNVYITLPAPMTSDPIIIEDDGNGMTEAEVRCDYLNIASSRTSRKGARSLKLNRLVKGRRGIGKFAGLLVADSLTLVTNADGRQTEILIEKESLLSKQVDIENIPLDINVSPSKNMDAHGTKIVLMNFNQRLSFPSADKLRELLALDYGKENSISLYINGEKISNYHVRGVNHETSISTSRGEVTFKLTIAEKPLSVKKSGIALKEGNKTIGRVNMWGLEDNPQLSNNLRNRVVGEIIVPPGMVDLTAGGIDFIEGDVVIGEIKDAIQEIVPRKLHESHTQEVNLAKARWQKELNKRLALLPDYRRDFIKNRLEKLISYSYSEGFGEDKISVLVNLVVEALEKDEYWKVCNALEQADFNDVVSLASTLNEFALADLSFIAMQASRRRILLDGLMELANNPETTEKQMHTPLAESLWIFGAQYSMMASNRQLASIINNYCDKNYVAGDSKNRPDLLLSGGVDGRHLLIEFKRPSYTVGRDDEAQAKKYADSLSAQTGMSLEIIVVGGKVDERMCKEYSSRNTRFTSYSALFSDARTQLEWLIRELNQYPRLVNTQKD